MHNGKGKVKDYWGLWSPSGWENGISLAERGEACFERGKLICLSVIVTFCFCIILISEYILSSPIPTEDSLIKSRSAKPANTLTPHTRSTASSVKGCLFCWLVLDVKFVATSEQPSRNVQLRNGSRVRKKDWAQKRGQGKVKDSKGNHVTLSSVCFTLSDTACLELMPPLSPLFWFSTPSFILCSSIWCLYASAPSPASRDLDLGHSPRS